MFQGKLLQIAVAAEAGAPLKLVENATAIAGKGLAGDRYAELRGIWQKREIEPEQQVTLIEREAVEAARSDYSLEFSHEETRRNLLTEGVPLNHLVGRRFRVGAAVLEGVKLCEPCGYLEKITACEGIKKSLLHRGGLRARVIEGGEIRPGDEISPAELQKES